jgi:sporulation protein YlmC with PRC-barrel domain
MVRHADGHEYTASPVAQPKLVKLSDSGFRLKDRASDVRGLGVFGRNGERMGSVKNLYVDTLEREVRFLDVGAGGFLGLREKRFLIPVEAVAEFREGGVTVDQQSREKISESPLLNTKLVPRAAAERDV